MRTMLASKPRNSAKPPHTPATFLFAERTNFLSAIFLSFYDFGTKIQKKRTTSSSILLKVLKEISYISKLFVILHQIRVYCGHTQDKYLSVVWRTAVKTCFDLYRSLCFGRNVRGASLCALWFPDDSRSSRRS